MAFARGRFDALRRRAELLDRTRAWFRDAGFLEVETPLLVESPGTEVHLDPVPARLTPRPGAAPEPRWLITSPELHMKRLLAAGSPPIFQLARVFRDGERGYRHRPEFTMLEWYRPWAGYEALMEDCEGWIRTLAGSDRLVYQGRAIDLTPPWPRLRFFDALRERADVVEPERLDPDQQLMAFVDRVERTLGVDRPEFLIEWPITMASLARRAPHDPRVAERFELFIAELELGNAFGELTDAAEQRERCVSENAERREQGRPELPLDEAFLGALTDGMPPSAGIAVGIDRVIMLLTDAASIDEVVAF
ncbi:MAG: EF-P lysine aminoacylase GenX [Deltaproteobacteria bacterium]|nr:MAG: EF-P lysine aminoacylase GenX [Deltaproteobacteria bacterium]